MPAFENWSTKPANRRWAAGLSLGIVLLCIYYPVLTFDYLYHDDWIHFTGPGSTCSASTMYAWSKVTGRPLGQYVLCALFGLFETTEEAWQARLVIVGGIAAFAWLQSIYFQALGISWRGAVALAVGASVLPGILIFGYWITAGSIVFSLLPSVAAALLTAAALRAGEGRARRDGAAPPGATAKLVIDAAAAVLVDPDHVQAAPLRRAFAQMDVRSAALLAGACGLQVVSLLIYQTQAMYFWALAAVMLATMLARDLRSAVRPLAAYTLVGAGPMAGYFIWFKYFSGFAPVLETSDPQRGRMFQDLAAGVTWFLKEALPRASSLWFWDRPRGFGLAVLAVFVLSLLLLSARLSLMTWRQGDRTGSFLYAVYPLVIVALGFFAFLPMLVTGFRLEVFRSLIPLSALIFLSGVMHLHMLLRVEKWPLSIRRGVAGGFVLGLSCLAADSLVAQMVLPAAAEYSFVRSSLLEAAQNGRAADRVHAIVPRMTLDPKTDEIHRLTVQFTQDIGPMIQAIRRELGFGSVPVPVTYSLEGEPFERDGALVFDFSELSKSGLWKSVFPFRNWITISPLNSDPRRRRPYAFVREVKVSVKRHGARDAVVRFTTDGTPPTSRSKVIDDYITLTNSTILAARAFIDEAAVGPVWEAEFERWDDDGAAVTDIKRGGDPAERIRIAVQPGGRVALVVNDANDGIDYDEGDWADAAFECASGRVYLSQLQAESAKQDWGSLVNDRNLHKPNKPIQIGGQVYQRGLAVSANAELVYAVPPGCKELVTWVGIDDAAERKGSVRFIVRPIGRAADARVDSQPRLLLTRGSYNLVAFRGLTYGVPQSLGPVNWEGGGVAKLPGVITGASTDEVISRLPPDPSIDPQPRLLRSHQGYNLVGYRGRIYGIPQSLGPVSLESGQVAKLPGVVTGGTVEEVLARLPR